MRKCPACGAVNIQETGRCGACSARLDSAPPARPAQASSGEIEGLLTYAIAIPVGIFVAFLAAFLLSYSRGMPLQTAFFLIAAITIGLGVFGFLFGGVATMASHQPWNPYYAREASKTLREDQPSRMKASIIFLAVGAIVLMAAFLQP